MRVLYFIGSYGPHVMGNASHEQTIVALRGRGHDVEVLTQVHEPGMRRYTRTHYSGVPVYRVNLAARHGRLGGLAPKLLGRFLKYEYMLTLISAYRRLMTRRYDLVHVEGAYPFGFVAALGSGGTPYLANVQGADVIDLPEYDYGYRRFRVPRLACAFALRRAALIRVISPLLGEYLQSEGLADSSRLVVVLRAIEDSAFPPANTSLETLRLEGRGMLTRKHGVGLPRPVIMALSRLHPFKGLEYLIDAIPIVVAAHRKNGIEPPWFLICGPARTTESYGDYKEFLRKRAESLGVASHVIFTGQVAHEDVRSYLAGADILVNPSVIEAQNKVVPEAAAVGTPSVVTSTTGIASYFGPQNACMLVPPRSAEAIAVAITQLLNDPLLYEQLKRNALRVAHTLRLEAVVPQLEAVWERAMGRHE